MRSSGILRKRLGAAALVLLVAVVALGIAIVVDGWVSFGQAPEGARLLRMEASPQWKDGKFANPQPMWNDLWGSLTGASPKGAATTPTAPIPVHRSDGSILRTPPSSGLRVTWMGHSSTLVEIDGTRVLFDPIFLGRASPVDWVGPDRWYAPPIPLDKMPAVEAVIISHDHYDHLSYPTIDAIKDWDTHFIVPLGVGAHLRHWGIPRDRITEMDWWDELTLGALRIVATPARHASGRHVFDQGRTLWASFALLGPAHRVFYSGDTGLFPGFADIGQRLGPFDLTLIEIGAYNRAWPDWHIGPEQAVKAHQMLRGGVLLPIHWGLWNLARHGWTEPAERVIVAADRAGVQLAMPRPGESIEPANIGPLARWWPDLPWQSAEDHPIVSTKNGQPEDRM
jgi:L-ascorbate metabolism protein UlaG (beta-lactamase superfamily)